MKKFLVLYRTPAEVLNEWMQKDEAERKEAEEKMKADWNVWMQNHGSAVTETAGAGKTKRITLEGAADTANDIMMYSMVEAESSEAAAQMFEGHPHLNIPQSSIDIMPANVLPGME